MRARAQRSVAWCGLTRVCAHSRAAGTAVYSMVRACMCGTQQKGLHAGNAALTIVAVFAIVVLCAALSHINCTCQWQNA